jgi:hypothetical protein
MHVPAVETDHPEVRRIQPSWHCLLRFRQRGFRDPGAAAATDALRDVLREADVARVPPSWAAGQSAAWWAVDGDLAFPLAPLADQGGGTWLALTCLVR